MPLLQHSASRHAAPLDTGAAGYCADAPAPDHRTGRRAAPPPPALFTPAPRLAPPPAWDEKDRDLFLKSANRQRYTEASGIRIRAFVEETENFLEMCGRPRDRWSRFILFWLGTNEAEKVHRVHYVGDAVFNEQFCHGLYTLFGRLDFEDAYSQQLRVLAQSGSESVAAFASRTSDLSTRAYPGFPTELQLDLTVDHFISARRDFSTRNYLRRERARRRIEWQEAVHIAQACEAPHATEFTPPVPAAYAVSTICAKPVNFAHIASPIADCAIAVQSAPGNSGNAHSRGRSRKNARRTSTHNPQTLAALHLAPHAQRQRLAVIRPTQRRAASCSPRTVHTEI